MVDLRRPSLPRRLRTLRGRRSALVGASVIVLVALSFVLGPKVLAVVGLGWLATSVLGLAWIYRQIQRAPLAIQLWDDVRDEHEATSDRRAA